MHAATAYRMMTQHKVKMESAGSMKESWFELKKVLPINTHQCWFKALVHNKVEVVQSVLQGVEEEKKQALLHGRFDFQDEHQKKYCAGKWFHLQLPFSIALTSGSFEVIAELMRHGLDPCERDGNGNNCLHSLVIKCFYMPENEHVLEKYYRRLLDLLSPEQIRLLLMADNKDGLRPLEFASQQGTLQILEAMMLTRGVYLTKEEIKGLVCYQWLDITEYESFGAGNRRKKSPLRALMYLERGTLSSQATKSLFSSQFVQGWVAAKMKCNIFPIMVWFLVRLVHIVTFFVFQADISLYFEVPATIGENGETTENKSSIHDRVERLSLACPVYADFGLTQTQRLTLMVYLLVHSGCIILFDSYHIFRNFFCPLTKYGTSLKGSKTWAMHQKFYRSCQFLTGMLIGGGMTMVIWRTRSGDEAASYLQIASCVVSVWSMLYFVQLLPSIGHFVIVVQHMLRDLLHFIIIFIMMLTPFVQVLFILMNVKARKGCVHDFNSYWSSFYTTFKMMLNMVDFSKYEVDHEAAFSFLHIMYVFVVAILLINFLIALMSNSVSEVAERKDIIMAIQRLSVAWTLELRLGWLLAPLYQRLQQVSFDCENGRIYLVRVIFNWDDARDQTEVIAGKGQLSTETNVASDGSELPDHMVKYIF